MKIRRAFLADKNRIMLLMDLSRVEDRVVQMYSGIWAKSPRMLAIANDRVVDTHAENAKAIMDALGFAAKDIEDYHAAYTHDKTSERGSEFKKKYRQWSKKVTHGVQRALGARGLSSQFDLDGVNIPPMLCQKMIDAYLAKDHEIRDFYFPTVENLIMKDHGLTNAFGRCIDWRYRRIDNALLRKGYSYLPQSECADLMNTRGVIATDEWLEAQKMQSEVQAQVHDEIIISAVPEEAYEIACFVRQSIEVPYMIHDNPLSVPVDLCIAVNWADKHEFSEWPDKTEMQDKIKEMMKD